MSLLNLLLLLTVHSHSLREELDLFRSYRGCDFCEVCCIGAHRCGDEEECRLKDVTTYTTFSVFSVMILLLIAITIWHCARRGKGINQV